MSRCAWTSRTPKTNVKLVGVGAGLGYGPAGATHHAIEDLAVMRALPGMTILCPGDPHETRELTRQSVDYTGPVYLRLGKGGEAAVHERPVMLGKPIEVRAGDRLTLALHEQRARGRRAGRGSSEEASPSGASTPSSRFRRPRCSSSPRKGTPIATLEEHSRIGGLGSAVAELLAESGHHPRFRRFGLPDEYTHVVGSQNYLRKHYGLDAESLAKALGALL